MLDFFIHFLVNFSVDVAIWTVKIKSFIFPKGRSPSIGTDKKYQQQRFVYQSSLFSAIRKRNNERPRQYLMLLSWSYIHTFFCDNRKLISLFQCHYDLSASRKTILQSSILPATARKHSIFSCYDPIATERENTLRNHKPSSNYHLILSGFLCCDVGRGWLFPIFSCVTIQNSTIKINPNNQEEITVIKAFLIT